MDKKLILPWVLAAGSLMAAIGFSSPSSRAKVTDKKIDEIETRVNNHDVQFKGFEKDLQYISKGVDILLQRRTSSQ